MNQRHLEVLVTERHCWTLWAVRKNKGLVRERVLLKQVTRLAQRQNCSSFFAAIVNGVDLNLCFSILLVLLESVGLVVLFGLTSPLW